MRSTTEELATAIATVGAALRKLPLDGLPEIVSVVVACVSFEPLRVQLQLGGSYVPLALAAWADALPNAAASARWGADHIRIEVSGELAGVPVSVWDHLNEELPTAAQTLGLSPDPEDRATSAVLLAALGQLGGQGVLFDA